MADIDIDDEVLDDDDDDFTPPSLEICEPLQEAFAAFNHQLFNDSLPDDCMITIQRKDKRTRGYFSPRRFGQVVGDQVIGATDVIAMNSEHFKGRSIVEALSTLAHEMVHLWQHTHGKPSRNGYHSKEWAAKMKEIGLQPSSTGQPGGKEVGQRVTHYIIEGGRFEAVANGLVKYGLHLPWAELVPDAGRRAPTRVTYICPECNLRMMGKRGVGTLACGCSGTFRQMEEVTEAAAQPASVLRTTDNLPESA
jgi:predicted SprT family Zn-dependent metalloprotease